MKLTNKGLYSFSNATKSPQGCYFIVRLLYLGEIFFEAGDEFKLNEIHSAPLSLYVVYHCCFYGLSNMNLCISGSNQFATFD
jgi:hypothetical protein